MAQGSIRLANKRNKADGPKQGEIPIQFDRSNPILGNRHILQNVDDDGERKHVIDLFKQDIDQDFQNNGPKYRVCAAIAEGIKEGKHYVGLCWCAPKACHGDIIINRIQQMLTTGT